MPIKYLLTMSLGQIGIPDTDACAFGLGARYILWEHRADIGSLFFDS